MSGYIKDAMVILAVIAVAKIAQSVLPIPASVSKYLP